jgi:hypothetical protein
MSLTITVPQWIVGGVRSIGGEGSVSVIGARRRYAASIPDREAFRRTLGADRSENLRDQ